MIAGTQVKKMNINDLLLHHQAGWCSDKVLDLYSESAKLESRTGHQLSWLSFVWISSVLKLKFRDSS
jgi:hypothetical protein